MTLADALLMTALVILVYMLAIWLASLIERDSSIIDFLWGPGFVLVAWFTAFRADGDPTRQIVLAGLVTIWGLRLGIYLFLRNAGKGEDYRYARWREQAGASWWWRSLFKVNLLQGALMWLVAVPLIVALHSPTPPQLTLLDYLGAALWGIGFFFEAVGDWQLARFRADPANKGQVLDSGLWRYTRHPNYFGDALLWWGFYCFALAVGGWWTIFSPVLMTLLLVRVSGVALLEKDLRTRKPQYRDYVRRTSAFVPLPPKK